MNDIYSILKFDYFVFVDFAKILIKFYYLPELGWAARIFVSYPCHPSYRHYHYQTRTDFDPKQLTDSQYSIKLRKP